MSERDMMYGGYYQNFPGSMAYGNFGYQGGPGSLLSNGMLGNYQNGMQGQMDMSNNVLNELNTRIRNLENRVKVLEQKVLNNNSYQDDNSMYMI